MKGEGVPDTGRFVEFSFFFREALKFDVTYFSFLLVNYFQLHEIHKKVPVDGNTAFKLELFCTIVMF